MSDESPPPTAATPPDVPAWDRRRDRRTLWGLIAAVLAVYLLTASYGFIQVNDNRAVNISAWALGTQFTFELPAEWEGDNRWIVEGRDGALYTNRFPGAIVWAAPFHTVGELLFDRGQPGHPAFLNYAPGGVAAATATALAVGVSFLVFRRLAGRRLAVASSLVLAFGTGTWSVSADAMWTHGLTQLTLLLGLLAAIDGRHVRSGLAFGAAVFTRPHTAFVAATVGIWRSATTRRWRPMIVIGVVSLLGVLAMALYSRALFETWVPVAGYNTAQPAAVATTGLDTTIINIGKALGDPTRGALIHTPFLIVMLPFLPYGWRASPPWARSAAAAGLIYLAVQMRVNAWHGGGSFFGSRLTLETLTLLSPMLLRTWQERLEPRRLLKVVTTALIGLALVIHAVGATIWSMDPLAVELWQQELDGYCEAEPHLEEC